MTPTTDTPAALGYRMPAEWEPHEATWIAWPHNRDDWPGRFGPVPWVYVELVRILSRVEMVHVLINGAKAQAQAARRLELAGVEMARVAFFQARTDRSWTRDYVPSFVVNHSSKTDRVRLVDWKFTGWAKYDNHRHDNRIARVLAQRLSMKRWKARTDLNGKPVRIVLEGGSIDVNGCGTVLATEECLLSSVQERNPGLDRAAIERALHNYLGTRHAIWLDRGIAGDDTHGHVDDIARFVGPRTVVAAVEEDRADPNYEPLQENLERLKTARDQDGKPLKIVSLPMPAPVIFEGQRLPASYANFYIANGMVLVPTFNDARDSAALAVLSAAFKDRIVVGVHSRDLVWGLGTLHCMTHEQPSAAVPVTARKRNISTKRSRTPRTKA
jgi:agmatine deiminase